MQAELVARTPLGRKSPKDQPAHTHMLAVMGDNAFDAWRDQSTLLLSDVRRLLVDCGHILPRHDEHFHEHMHDAKRVASAEVCRPGFQVEFFSGSRRPAKLARRWLGSGRCDIR